ncbi:hypothetical protein [Pseudomonas sp. NPDC086278]|uniref:hypothetical protein n=1 Tax=Pseudomonas sp. NPDC086278 TaxID=3390646 RepID=UPI003CFD9EC7
MNNRRVASVAAVLLLMTASVAGLMRTEGNSDIGVWIYAAVAILAIACSHGRPDAWPGRVFEPSRSSRSTPGHRLLTQMAALVCLLSAQYLSGEASAIASVAGVLLFIHTLVLVHLPRLVRATRTH